MKTNYVVVAKYVSQPNKCQIFDNYADATDYAHYLSGSTKAFYVEVKQNVFSETEDGPGRDGVQKVLWSIRR